MDYQLFQEIILEHYRNPRHKGVLQNPDFEAREANPLCGDTLALYIKLDKDKKHVKEAWFQGIGCAISQAAASLMTEYLEGLSIEQARNVTRADVLQLLGGIELSPARLKCAFLVLETLKKALQTVAKK